MFKWEKNEMRKKQIINSTVASGDGSENETKTRRKPFAKQREGKKKKERKPTCPLTNLLMYGVKWTFFMALDKKPFIIH